MAELLQITPQITPDNPYRETDNPQITTVCAVFVSATVIYPPHKGGLGGINNRRLMNLQYGKLNGLII